MQLLLLLIIIHRWKTKLKHAIYQTDLQQELRYVFSVLGLFQFFPLCIISRCWNVLLSTESFWLLVPSFSHLESYWNSDLLLTQVLFKCVVKLFHIALIFCLWVMDYSKLSDIKTLPFYYGPKFSRSRASLSLFCDTGASSWKDSNNWIT